MTESRLAEIEQLCQQYGASNGWTGTSGMLATVIRELVAEVKQIRNAVTDNLERASMRRSKMRKCVDSGVADATHLAYLDGMVEQLESLAERFS